VWAASIISYAFVDRGGLSLITRGGTGSPVTGYVRIQPNGLNTVPSGLAIFGYRQGGVLVSEAGVPASPLIQSGRMWAEVNGPVNTGIAIANPNPQPASISFYFTNSSGDNFGAGTTVVAANSQIAAFLNQLPFNGGNSVAGTFTFTSSIPVAVIALRGLTNERNEFLITTLPVTSLSPPAPGAPLLSHFADGGGWTTQVILVNPGDSALSGTVQFFSQGDSTAAGQPLRVEINGQTGTTFNYTVQPRSSIRLQTSGTSTATSSGAVRVTPSANQAVPSGLAIFSRKSGPFTVSEASVPASRAASAFRLYAETSGEPGSILTGVAVANPASRAVSVKFEVTPLVGGPPILTTMINVPANGQIARFLNEIPGLEPLPRPFKGVVRIVTSPDDAIAVIGLRSRVNERGDFLITTTPPVDEAVPAASDAVFPHFVDNGGYTTQFILYSGSTGQQSSGLIRVTGQNGQPLDLAFAPMADLAVTQTVSPDPPITPGSAVTYAVGITNNGPDQATGVQVTDVLPPGVPFEEASARQGACSPPSAGLLTCNLGNLPANSSTIVRIVVRPPSAATLSNAVTVGLNEDDPLPANNRNITTANVGIFTDLELTQTGPPACSLPGCNGLKYVITAQNRGPLAASNVMVLDTLPTDPPSGVVVATVQSATPSQGSCSGVSNGQFSCNIGLLAPGAAATINVALNIDLTAWGRVIVNRATVFSPDIVDTAPGGNSQEVRTSVFPTPAETFLEFVQFTSSPTSVNRGNAVTLNLSLQNRGPSTATAVMVTTKFSGLSGPITVRSAMPSQGSCSVSGSDIVCNLGVLVRNLQKTISMVIVPSAAGQLTAEATIKANSSELNHNSLNNTKSVTVTVN
jgi:uncharacterized repeat protein (TIGR01451 family)